MPGPRARGRRSMGVGLARIPIALLVLVGSLLLLLPHGASAHAGVVSTDPMDGARLPASPSTVSVTFNEPVTLAPGGLRVVRPDGSLADVGDELDTGTTVSQAIEPLPDGWYVMTWAIVSEDGHVVHGSTTFAVGDADAAARPSRPSPLDARDRAVAGTRPRRPGAAGRRRCTVRVGLLEARTRRVALWRGSPWARPPSAAPRGCWSSSPTPARRGSPRATPLSAITRLVLLLSPSGHSSSGRRVSASRWSPGCSPSPRLPSVARRRITPHQPHAGHPPRGSCDMAGCCPGRGARAVGSTGP